MEMLVHATAKMDPFFAAIDIFENLSRLGCASTILAYEDQDQPQRAL